MGGARAARSRPRALTPRRRLVADNIRTLYIHGKCNLNMLYKLIIFASKNINGHRNLADISPKNSIRGSVKMKMQLIIKYNNLQAKVT